MPPDSVWLEYAYHKHHPVLQYLPIKFAEWIGENMQDKLGFSDKRDTIKWSIFKLNNILQNSANARGERQEQLPVANILMP